MTGFAHLICDFTPASPGFVQCRRCRQTIAHDDPTRPPRFACRKQPARPTVRTATAPVESFEPTPPEALPCIHRGEVTRQEKCRRESCKGGVLFDVLSCAQFGECSIDPRAVRGLHVCKSCKDRTPPGGEPVGLTLATATPRERLALIQRPTVPIAVIIPCHNYGRFLDECITSVRNQTAQPAELLVVDDASTDDTAAVCERLGVRRLPVDYRNAHQTRGAGFAATTAEWVCFLDADDTIAPDYLGKAADRFAKGVGFVFSDVEQFGAASGRLVYEAGDISTRNFAHAGSVARRIALESAQVFDRVLPVEVLEDWWTWRRVLDAGWQAVKSPAIYRYRRHPGSRSAELVKRDQFDVSGLALEEITIAIPLAGRAQWWPRLRHWLVEQTWPKERTRLLLVDSSNDDAFGQEVRHWLAESGYPSTQYIAMQPEEPGLADADRHVHAVYRGVQRAMPRLYNRVRQEVTTSYVLIVEDDILPPTDVAERLLRSFDQDTVSVSGAYRSRYQDNYIAWTKSLSPIAQAGDGVEVVGGNGFGCVMFRTSVLKQTVLHHGGRAGDFDPNLYEDIDARWVAKLDWSVRCDHAGLAA
jgi:hypothetical protein